MRTSTLLPDGRRLVVDAATCLIGVLLAALVVAAVAAPGPGGLATDTALVALYVVPAQIVQAALGQLVLVRIGSVVGRALAMLGTWAVVLVALAYALPLLDPDGGVGLSGLVLVADLALLVVVRGSVVGVLGFDRRVAAPADRQSGVPEGTGTAPLG